MEIMTLGEKIRSRRRSLQMTLKDVADGHITAAQLCYIESDKCRPSDEVLTYICEKIKLDIEYVVESEVRQAERCCEDYISDYERFIKGGMYKKAKEYLLKVMEISKKYGLDRYSAAAEYKNGIFHYDRNDFDNAEYNFISALYTFMKLDDRLMIVNCYNYLSCISHERGYEENALVYMKCASE